MPRGPNGEKRPADVVGNAFRVMQIATGQIREDLPDSAAASLGRRGGLKGGKVRAAKLTAEQRSAIAKKAAEARWAKTEVLPAEPAIPVAKWRGELDLGGDAGVGGREHQAGGAVARLALINGQVTHTVRHRAVEAPVSSVPILLSGRAIARAHPSDFKPRVIAKELDEVLAHHTGAAEHSDGDALFWLVHDWSSCLTIC